MSVLVNVWKIWYSASECNTTWDMSIHENRVCVCECIFLKERLRSGAHVKQQPSISFSNTAVKGEGCETWPRIRTGALGLIL